jgi:DNA topoisomerase III
VLWPEYQDQPLELADIRQLLQRRVLRRTLHGEGSGEVVLALTEAGQVVEIPVPRKSQQTGGRRPAPQKSGRGRSGGRRRRPATEAAADAAPASASSATLGVCPLCGGAVSERPKSFSCRGGDGQCRFVIWKTIASKRITARTAQTLLQGGETPVIKGFQSKAGKSFSARLKLIDGQVKFVFEGKSPTN